VRVRGPLPLTGGRRLPKSQKTVKVDALEQRKLHEALLASIEAEAPDRVALVCEDPHVG
jgi:hypothetical protein